MPMIDCVCLHAPLIMYGAITLSTKCKRACEHGNLLGLCRRNASISTCVSCCARPITQAYPEYTRSIFDKANEEMGSALMGFEKKYGKVRCNGQRTCASVAGSLLHGSSHGMCTSCKLFV